VIQEPKVLGLPGFCLYPQRSTPPPGKRTGRRLTGTAEDKPPQKVDCAIDFTPVGRDCSLALSALAKGGRLVMRLIRKNTLIPPIDYCSIFMG